MFRLYVSQKVFREIAIKMYIYVTLPHKISLKFHFGYFEMCIILKTAASADYFGI